MKYRPLVFPTTGEPADLSWGKVHKPPDQRPMCYWCGCRDVWVSDIAPDHRVCPRCHPDVLNLPPSHGRVESRVKPAPPRPAETPKAEPASLATLVAGLPKRAKK